MKLKPTLYIFLLMQAFSLISFGQGSIQRKADSTKNIINSQDLSTSELLESYNWLAAYSQPLEQIEYGEKLLDLATRYRNTEYIYHANFNLGVAYRLIGKLDVALEYLFESAAICSESSSLQKYLPGVYSEISSSYAQNGDARNALLFGSKSIDILRKEGSKKVLAISLLNHGYDYYLIGQYDSAKAYYNESEPVLREIDLKIGIAYLIGNRALVYWKTGDVDRAIADLFEAVSLIEPFGDTYGISDYYNQLGQIFYERGELDKAIEYTSKSFEMAKEDDFKEQARNAAELLSTVYKERNEYEKAFAFQSEYFKYRDNIQNLATTERLANLRIEFEVGRKQAQVDLLLEQKQSSRTIMIVGGISLVAVLALVVIIYASFKSKNELSKLLVQQKDSLVQVNDTKDRFFSIISHDLRGPVNALSGLVGVIKFYVNEGKTDQLLELTQRMEEATDKLIKLLDSLLSWSMQQQGHFRYLPEKLSANQLMEDVVDMFHNMAVSKRITLKTNVSADINLYADKNTSSTIFRNLVNNAIKFTGEGGLVELSTKLDREKRLALIEVKDNGIGISEEKLKTLFHLDENVSSRGTAGESGLGLGLQLVHEFVALNKGKIEVESELNKGTTFKVFLPFSEGA